MEEQNFEQFLNKLQELGADLDGVARRVVNRAVNEGMTVTIKNTPVNKSPHVIGGTLRKGWISSPAKKSGKKWQGSFSNNVEYGIYVNFGHRIVVKGKTVGYCPGQFFLEAGANHVIRNMNHYFKDEIKSIRGEW